ncbi:hypothetical protein HGM15179_009957 [Zosterops borbonicus]|uniref:Uncharacterized protein n=1 Tax=Zosterops borbonicus TaxID=364589 RepID=A0A8K1LKH8_9PASS|nr:hypothetical protein HGM15179_009957 [Zosterops borbonicus]
MGRAGFSKEPDSSLFKKKQKSNFIECLGFVPGTGLMLDNIHMLNNTLLGCSGREGVKNSILWNEGTLLAAGEICESKDFVNREAVTPMDRVSSFHVDYHIFAQAMELLKVWF